MSSSLKQVSPDLLVPIVVAERFGLLHDLAVLDDPLDLLDHERAHAHCNRSV